MAWLAPEIVEGKENMMKNQILIVLELFYGNNFLNFHLMNFKISKIFKKEDLMKLH